MTLLFLPLAWIRCECETEIGHTGKGDASGWVSRRAFACRLLKDSR